MLLSSFFQFEIHKLAISRITMRSFGGDLCAFRRISACVFPLRRCQARFPSQWPEPKERKAEDVEAKTT